MLQHSHEVLALAWAPSGKLLASATLDGQIYLWDPLEAELQVPSSLSCIMCVIYCLLLVPRALYFTEPQIC